jgi:hypothetical protein
MNMMTETEIATARADGHDATCADAAMEIVTADALDAGKDVIGRFDELWNATRTLWETAADRLAAAEIECVCASSYRQGDDGEWLAA